MITEDYVSFETAKLLKEKGFDEYCGYYSSNGEYCGYCVYNHKGKDFISAPTLQMAMKWLREVHKIYIYAAHDCMDIWFARVYNDYKTLFDVDNHSSYEQACEAAIKYCLENLI